MAKSMDNEVSDDPTIPDPQTPGSFGIPPKRSPAGTKKIVLLGIWLTLLVGLVVGINLLGGKQPGTGGTIKAPADPVPKIDTVLLAAQWPQIVAHAAAPPRGSANARYTLAEFGDFQCPQCGKARPVLENLLAKHPGQINLIFLHRPFPNMHQWALPSGQAAEIAAAQGKFWPMYDVLYSHQDDLEPGFYGDYAVKAGLDKAAFQKAFDAGQGITQLKDAARFSDDVKIQLTPTVLVHDNVANTLALYAGLQTAGNAKAGLPYQGLDALIAHPPWGK